MFAAAQDAGNRGVAQRAGFENDSSNRRPRRPISSQDHGCGSLLPALLCQIAFCFAKHFPAMSFFGGANGSLLRILRPSLPNKSDRLSAMECDGLLGPPGSLPRPRQMPSAAPGRPRDCSYSQRSRVANGRWLHGRRPLRLAAHDPSAGSRGW
jgi:hypothetical protein